MCPASAVVGGALQRQVKANELGAPVGGHWQERMQEHVMFGCYSPTVVSYASVNSYGTAT